MDFGAGSVSCAWWIAPARSVDFGGGSVSCPWRSSWIPPGRELCRNFHMLLLLQEQRGTEQSLTVVTVKMAMPLCARDQREQQSALISKRRHMTYLKKTHLSQSRKTSQSHPSRGQRRKPSPQPHKASRSLQQRLKLPTTPRRVSLCVDPYVLCCGICGERLRTALIYKCQAEHQMHICCGACFSKLTNGECVACTREGILYERSTDLEDIFRLLKLTCPYDGCQGLYFYWEVADHLRVCRRRRSHGACSS